MDVSKVCPSSLTFIQQVFPEQLLCDKGENTKPNNIQPLPLRCSPASGDVLALIYVSHSEKETKSIAYKSFTEGHLTQQVEATREVRESFQGMFF